MSRWRVQKLEACLPLILILKFLHFLRCFFVEDTNCSKSCEWMIFFGLDIPRVLWSLIFFPFNLCQRFAVHMSLTRNNMSLTRNNMYIYVCKRSHSFHPSQLLLLLVMVGGFPSLAKLFRRERCKTNTYLGTTHSRSYRGGKGHPIPAYRNCSECLCEQFENNRCCLGSEPCCKN